MDGCRLDWGNWALGGTVQVSVFFFVEKDWDSTWPLHPWGNELKTQLWTMWLTKIRNHPVFDGLKHLFVVIGGWLTIVLTTLNILNQLLQVVFWLFFNTELSGKRYIGNVTSWKALQPVVAINELLFQDHILVPLLIIPEPTGKINPYQLYVISCHKCCVPIWCPKTCELMILTEIVTWDVFSP